jgi:23S rRNA (adenine2503-C2)-methyltransferase
MTGEALADLMAALGQPAYRAGQITSWVYYRLAWSFDEMTDLPAALRAALSEKVRLHGLSLKTSLVAGDGTVKALFSLADGRTIEAALMNYGSDSGGRRNTVCVSTQVGCPIGCPFCATGRQRFERNLSPGEIVDQVLFFARYLKDHPVKEGVASQITNIVFMGMGEPLANYDALWQAIERLNSPEYFGLGARNMTISTAGMLPQIACLAGERLQVGLSISLHAAENGLRDKLVPLNRRYPLEMLIPACREYARLSGRRVTFEYALFAGINDSVGQARVLAHLLKGLLCHVNLIPANANPGSDFTAPAWPVVLAFQKELKRLGINATVRQSKGQGIEAGCGQLRSRDSAS